MCNDLCTSSITIEDSPLSRPYIKCIHYTRTNYIFMFVHIFTRPYLPLWVELDIYMLCTVYVKIKYLLNLLGTMIFLFITTGNFRDWRVSRIWLSTYSYLCIISGHLSCELIWYKLSYEMVQPLVQNYCLGIPILTYLPFVPDSFLCFQKKVRTRNRCMEVGTPRQILGPLLFIAKIKIKQLDVDVWAH